MLFRRSLFHEKDDWNDVIYRSVVALLIASLLGIRGYRKNSLSLSGAFAAVVVGFLTFFSGIHFAVILLSFFFASSRITKVQQQKKRRLEADFKEGGQRDLWQVFSNSIPAVVVALLYYRIHGTTLSLESAQEIYLIPISPCFLFSFCLGFYACCSGDTWSSELGILANSNPILITNFRKVPPGTNGGITLVGILAAIAGGSVVGISTWATVLLKNYHQEIVDSSLENAHFLIFVGAIAGLVGSLIDSLLGATVQFSGFSKILGRSVNCPSDAEDVKKISGWNLLSNNQVNLISASLTGIVSGVSLCIWNRSSNL